MYFNILWGKDKLNINEREKETFPHPNGNERSNHETVLGREYLIL